MNAKYRYGVGAMILNNDKKIFVARRADYSSGLQMPQGGIEQGEDLETSLYRELKEEIGTNQVNIIQKIRHPLYYNFPYYLSERIYKGQYIGQGIHWFLVHFTGDDKDINLCTEDQELSDWEWLHHSKLVDNVVGFKKTMYYTVLESFKDKFKDKLYL
jgi:putative (di)nucleoside polyphosphate hydrolase